MDAAKGDWVKVVGETRVTARVVGIGPDASCGDDKIRYHLDVHPDDAGIIFGDDLVNENLILSFRMTVPIDSEKIKVFKL